ncbi:MAG TPA: TetR/AcrR family transcriptional regulator C-terminal domain-containing protein [Candidatus Limnocylindria bacterium]|nr:TetR/AcrR family transcriptional regulator C-terminal domain-containing protein [Candidatus Limnocylindria bacterium]
MATRTEPSAEPRMPLSKERVLRAAVALADKGGIESLSMRKLAQELGVEAMSLYNHVRNKDDILDGIVDVILGEIELPPTTTNWKTSMRQTVLSARKVLLAHPWAPRVLESRKNPSPATFQYFESVIGILRTGGFSVDQAHHALHVLGSRVLGFTQELFKDSDELASGPEAEAMYAQMAQTFPYMIEMAMAVTHEGGLGGCDDDVEFVYALDLILDGLARARDAESARSEHELPR